MVRQAHHEWLGKDFAIVLAPVSGSFGCRRRQEEATTKMPWGSGPAAQGCPATLGSPPRVSFYGEGGVAGISSATERGVLRGTLKVGKRVILSHFKAGHFEM